MVQFFKVLTQESKMLLSQHQGFFHVAQAVFLSLPWNKYTISQSLSAWKKGRAKHLLGPNAVAIT